MTLAKSPFPKPRQAVTRRLLCPQSNELLDKGMVVWFPGTASEMDQVHRILWKQIRAQ